MTTLRGEFSAAGARDASSGVRFDGGRVWRAESAGRSLGALAAVALSDRVGAAHADVGMGATSQASSLTRGCWRGAMLFLLSGCGGCVRRYAGHASVGIGHDSPDHLCCCKSVGSVASPRVRGADTRLIRCGRSPVRIRRHHSHVDCLGAAHCRLCAAAGELSQRRCAHSAAQLRNMAWPERGRLPARWIQRGVLRGAPEGGQGRCDDRPRIRALRAIWCGCPGTVRICRSTCRRYAHRWVRWVTGALAPRRPPETSRSAISPSLRHGSVTRARDNRCRVRGAVCSLARPDIEPRIHPLRALACWGSSGGTGVPHGASERASGRSNRSAAPRVVLPRIRSSRASPICREAVRRRRYGTPRSRPCRPDRPDIRPGQVRANGPRHLLNLRRSY